MSDILPAGHPLPWVELVEYERQQGGYWFYPAGRDLYGNDKVWVSVPNPAWPLEVGRCPHCGAPKRAEQNS